MSTTTATPILTGVTNDKGQCDRCNRELGKVYEVRHPDGTTATYGRRCCAKVTGYRGDLDRAVRSARRQVVITARRATMVAAGHDVVDVASTPAEHYVWYVLTGDGNWAGHDEDGRPGNLTWEQRMSGEM